MPRQYLVLTTRRPAGIATRRRWALRVLVAVAAAVLGLLPGIQGLAPSSPAVVQAAQQDHSTAAPPASGTAVAAPPTDQGPTRDPLDDAVTSSGAPDEQLDVSAALDQGARLFFLQARYQDGDYYLAGPQGISHQPLRELFAPLAAWLAAPGHEHVLLWLGLETDPRTADPASFDAACQAFTAALGPYLLKASDLPEGKTLGKLAPAELAALQTRPLLRTDWSACTGEESPIAQPAAPSAVASTDYEHWMADNADFIRQRPLRQVVLPGSHDSATFSILWHKGSAGAGYAGGWTRAQAEDIPTQLDDGARYLDLRFACVKWQTGHNPGTCDATGYDHYVNFHGDYWSETYLDDVLNEVVGWVDQPAHAQEIVVLDFTLGTVDNFGSDQAELDSLCKTWIQPELAAGRVIQPSMVPGAQACTRCRWTRSGTCRASRTSSSRAGTAAPARPGRQRRRQATPPPRSRPTTPTPAIPPRTSRTGSRRTCSTAETTAGTW